MQSRIGLVSASPATVSPFRGYRFPPEIISYAVWLYHRFALSHRDVEELLAERGILVSYEASRLWCHKFGPLLACELRRRRARRGDKWFLDEVALTMNKHSFHQRLAQHSHAFLEKIHVTMSLSLAHQLGQCHAHLVGHRRWFSHRWFWRSRWEPHGGRLRQLATAGLLHTPVDTTCVRVHPWKNRGNVGNS
jgi:hypothetical protein